VIGDGPFYAHQAPEGPLIIDTSGVARWLTVTDAAVHRARLDNAPLPLDTSAADGARFYVPAGQHRIELRGQA